MYETLKERMKKQGITTNRLAKKANITPCDLYEVLNGHKKLFPRWRKSISTVLGVDENDLFPELQQELETKGLDMLRKFEERYGNLERFSMIVKDIHYL